MIGSSRAHIETVLEILHETERDGLLSARRGEGLSGISGLKTVGALQRLARLFAEDLSAFYLEIGVYQGLTLVSAALEAPEMPCLGIDNFSTLDPDGQNRAIAAGRLKKFGASNATLIDSDFEDALSDLDARLGGRKLAVYFVDGPHDYRSQMVCLLLAKPYLHERCIIVVDDANYPDVRHANRDFLAGHPDFKMIFEAYSPAHPANMSADALKGWEQGWLNGINILVRDPDGLLGEMLPPVDSERILYFNEWLVHRLRRAELAPEAVALADAICTGDAEAEKAARQALLRAYGIWRDVSDDRHPDRNTFSAGLTEGRFNEINE